MNSDFVVWLAIELFAIIGFRIVWGIGLVNLPKKYAKKYAAEVSLLDRWFFISAPKWIADEYNKHGKRYIRKNLLLRFYHILNFFNHGFFIINLSLVILHSNGFIKQTFADRILFSSLYIILAEAAIMAIIDGISNKDFHRARRRR